MATKTPGDLPRHGDGVRADPRDRISDGEGNGDREPTNGELERVFCRTFPLDELRSQAVEITVDEPVWGNVRNGRILVLHGSYGVLGLVPESVAAELLAEKGSGSLEARISKAGSKPADF